MKHFWSMAGVILVIGLIGSPLQAGLVMVYSEENYFQPAAKVVNTAYLDKGHIRVDIKGQNTDQTIIFRQDQQVVWFIENPEGTFMEVSRDDMQMAKGKMEEARAMVEQQMKNLPPEQRKMMEQIMKGQVPVMAPKIKYKKTATGVKIKSWVCDQYDGYLQGEKKEEVWTTDPKNLGIGPEELRVLVSMGEFFETSPQFKASFYKVGFEEGESGDGYSGIPIKGIVYTTGQKEEKRELEEIRRENLQPSLFEIPPGFKKRETYPPGGMRPR